MTSSSQGGSPGAGGASAGDRPVIVWHGGNGYYALSIYADGRAVYQMQSGGFGLPSTPPPPIEGRVPSERLTALRSLLASSLDTLRDMRPPLRNLVPGESTQTLDVDWDGLHVKLRMLSNDWSRNSASGACASELHLIATEVAKGR